MQKNHKLLAIVLTFFLFGAIFIFTGEVSRRGGVASNSNLASVVLAQTAVSPATKESSTFGTKSYVPLSVIPGLTDSKNSTVTMKPFLQLIFKWGIAIAVLLSIVMITFGGFQYMTTDAVYDKSEGRAKINAAIIGLLLALSAWLILQTVDPRIVQDPQSKILD